MSADFYFTRPRAQKGRRQLLIATFLFAGILLIDILTGGTIRLQVRAFATHVIRIGTNASAAILESGYFSSRRSLQVTIEALEDQLSQYSEQVALYQAAREENELLRAMVRLAEESPGITAPITSTFRSSPYGTFIIGAGIADGVSVGDITLTSGGFVIGRVSEVDEHSSLVTEIFAPGASVDAIIAGSATVIEGRGGGNAYARVSHGIEVKVGDPATAPSLQGRPVGIVGEVDSSGSSAYSDVYIGMPVNPASMKYVYVQK